MVVIGIGNPDRGDDGVGAAVIERLAAVGLPGVGETCELVALDGEVAGLIEAWDRRRLAIVVDAISLEATGPEGGDDEPDRSTSGGGSPGDLHRLVVGGERLGSRFAGPTSTHGIGLAEAVELARALGRLPDRLVIHGVQLAQVKPGSGLSAAVGAAVSDLADRVAAEVAIGGQSGAGNGGGERGPITRTPAS